MALIFELIRWACAIGQFVGHRTSQFKECELARTVDQWRQLDRDLPQVCDFKDQRTTPAWLHPWCRLMHAQTHPRIGAAALNSRDEVGRNLDRLVRLGQHEMIGLQLVAFTAAKLVGFLEFLCVPQAKVAYSAYPLRDGDGDVLVVTERRKLKAKSQIDGSLAPLLLFKSG